MLDVLCTGACPLQCTNGGTLNKETCSCTCPSPYVGNNCNQCGLEEKDCHHGTTLVGSTGKCTCIAPKDSGVAAVWGGVTGECVFLVIGCSVLFVVCCANCLNIYSLTLFCMLSGDQCLLIPPHNNSPDSVCPHGGSLNAKTCLCEGCNEEWR